MLSEKKQGRKGVHSIIYLRGGNWDINLSYLYIFIYLNILFIYFQREGKGKTKRGRETSMCKRYISWLPLTCPQLGTWPATQACVLTGNRTSDLLVCRMALNPLSHTSQDCIFIYLNIYIFTSPLPFLHKQQHIQYIVHC